MNRMRKDPFPDFVAGRPVQTFKLNQTQVVVLKSLGEPSNWLRLGKQSNWLRKC